MDSSFLIGIHFCMLFVSLVLFFKLIIQFGLPNHPKRFVSYALSFLVTLYLAGQFSADLGMVNPWFWMKWRALPLVAGSLFLLFQTIMLLGSVSFLQQKVMSRIPVLVSIMIFGFFSELADIFTVVFVSVSALVLLIPKIQSRHMKQIYFKFLLFSGLAWIMELTNYNLYLVGQVFGFFSLFYLFNFQHCFNINGLIDDCSQDLEEGKL